MNIFRVLIENLFQKPVTQRFQDRSAPVEYFRGQLRNNPDDCVGCGTCVYVCPSMAIELIESTQNFLWRYDPGKCTFCARCVDFCPASSLSMEKNQLPSYQNQGEIIQELRKDFPGCQKCNKPTQPVNFPVLKRVFSEVSPEVLEWSKLCTACRQEQIQNKIEKLLLEQRRDF
jgi:formate hydrogenlyase subunit 6/NADH:ubiquinone oxidoreductase subunit I